MWWHALLPLIRPRPRLAFLEVSFDRFFHIITMSYNDTPKGNLVLSFMKLYIIKFILGKSRSVKYRNLARWILIFVIHTNGQSSLVATSIILWWQMRAHPQFNGTYIYIVFFCIMMFLCCWNVLIWPDQSIWWNKSLASLFGRNTSGWSSFLHWDTNAAESQKSESSVKNASGKSG